jgi:hypothetical protein
MPGLYHPTHGWIPSVTEVLSAVGLAPDYSEIDSDVLAKAAERGREFHEAAEASHFGYLNRGALSPAVKPYFAGYERFLAETGHEPIVSELELVHPFWRVVGHVDRVGWEQDALRVLTDFKTATVVDTRAAALQLAGYRFLWNHCRPTEPIHATQIVQVTRDERYRVHRIDLNVPDPRCGMLPEQIFLAAVTVVHARGGVR